MTSPAIELLEAEIKALRDRVRRLEAANKDLFRINATFRAKLTKYEKMENELARVNT